MDAVISETKHFARYEIIRKLGRSMTDVYLAFDPKMHRRVILKVVEESRDDFTQLVIEAERRGAQIQSELHRLDSRILEVYECDVAEGSFFVSMEYFEGRNIAEILQSERRLDPKRAALYGAEICSQLDRLHSFISDVDGKKRAVVHGDIKPSNIQIGHSGELRLLDFGIAKVITSTRNLTQHNLGSPTYCSPERLAKGQVDPQADLWALGVSLYEMVAGTPPYQAQDTRKLENLIESRRPPRALPPSCPPPLAAIITKALAGEIERRYASALDFEKDLRAFIGDRPSVASACKQRAWESNATVQKFRKDAIPPRPGKPLSTTLLDLAQRLQPAIERNWVRVGSILFGVFAVFLLAYLVGRLRDEIWLAPIATDYTHASVRTIHSDWEGYQKLRRRDRFLGRFSPAHFRGQELKSRFVAAADEVIDAHRNSSDASLEAFDWSKAQLCLRHALEVDSNDRAVAGKLSLCEGYANLVRYPKLPKAAQSELDFRKAVGQMPRSPDPHLALAQLYVYAYQNIGRAIGELHQAEGLGFHAGPREVEEQADGYLYRAEAEWKHVRKSASSSPADQDRYLRMARADLDRARTLYEPISGFSNVTVSLDRVDQDQARINQLEADRRKPVHPRRRSVAHGRRYTSHARWH